MAFQATEVGDKLKVWSEGGKKPADGRPCVITSHGGQKAGHANFAVPAGVTLHFYQPEGGMLKADIVAMTLGKYVPFETIVGGPGVVSRDYDLTKFQGEKHGGGKENYDYIQSGMHPEVQLELMQKQGGWRAEQLAEVAGNKIIMDVVTVRNRTGIPGLMYPPPSLGEAIKILHDNGWNYKEIHCSFCRYAPGVGDIKLEGITLFSAKLKKPP